MVLSPSKLLFCLLSFEGPDRYATAGGLGVRIGHLAETLAQRGFETHLFFVGDPAAPGKESREDGRLILHRWCQWISAYHPDGVYAGEEEKLWDFNESLPPFLIDTIIRPALASGRLPVVLAEEWHTVEALIRLHERLNVLGLRQQCVFFWNANNTMSFHRVDWPRLNAAAQLTTVSRYMKHLMWRMGLNPLVIPNGIPSRLLTPVDSDRVATLRSALTLDDDSVMLFKVGRFDPDKRWLMAVEAVAELKQSGHQVAFPFRGGIESHGVEVLRRARELGLSVIDVTGEPESWADVLSLLQAVPRGDIYNLRFFMTDEMLRPFYRAADVVLANSGHEPFGLVGLEAMAAGGLVFTGATGEEYTSGGQSAIVLDTDAPGEIVSHVLALKANPKRIQAMRQAARKRAADFTWERVSVVLLDKIKFVAEETEALRQASHQNGSPQNERVEAVLIYTVVHQPLRLRLPAVPLPSNGSRDVLTEALFDDALNEKYFRKVVATCYYPALEQFQLMLAQGFKFSIGFSLSFIEQAQRWDRALLDRFRRVVQHENVELVAVEPTHGFIMLWDVPCFLERMCYAADKLEQIFGIRPLVADTTELMMSDNIYHALDLAGFKAGFLDGRDWIMGWRQPTHLYHHSGGQMKLLARHYQLSDDVGYRFSNKEWEGWPLSADTYARWLADQPGDLVVLGWDFETFGEHHHPDTGIFEFITALPDKVKQVGLSFLTPSEAVNCYQDRSYDLPLPANAVTWAGGGDLEFFLGNDAQRAVFQLMIQAYNKARLTGNPALVDLALWLAQSDNLHLIQWHGRSDSEAEVSTYFTPNEWWSLGPDGIIREMQQVYKNFIAVLDFHLPESGSALT